MTMIDLDVLPLVALMVLMTIVFTGIGMGMIYLFKAVL